jgi:hypothetical protein
MLSSTSDPPSDSVLSSAEATAQPKPEEATADDAAITEATVYTQTDQEQDFVMPQPMPFVQGEINTEFGIQIHGCGPDANGSVKAARELGFSWIKQQVRWGDMSPRKGVMDWGCLDRVMAAARAYRMKVLLSVTTAPRYFREMRNVQGFPDDLSHFAYFINELLGRYPKQVHGLEVWNEPNIDAEVSEGINYARYDLLLALGFAVAKTHDPNILVISAGLAPVDTESFFTRVSDTEFLTKVFERGTLEHVDCIGAHANGPDGRGDLAPLSEHYFGLTDSTKPVCITEFGYAIPVLGQMPCGFDFAKAHTAAQQGPHLVQGMDWARRSGYARLVIVWNLDVYSSTGAKDCNVPYTLWRSDWQSPALPLLKQYLAAHAN